MANNRLLIYCKECLGFMAIAKYYPVAWGVWDEDGLGLRINEFFDKHQPCLEKSGVDLGMDADIVRMTTENTWKGYLSYKTHKLYKTKPKDWD